MFFFVLKLQKIKNYLSLSRNSQDIKAKSIFETKNF